MPAAVERTLIVDFHEMMRPFRDKVDQMKECEWDITETLGRAIMHINELPTLEVALDYLADSIRQDHHSFGHAEDGELLVEGTLILANYMVDTFKHGGLYNNEHGWLGNFYLDRMQGSTTAIFREDLEMEHPPW